MARPNDSLAQRGPLHAFVDESKRKGFSLIRCDIPADQVNDVRAELRSLLRGGQRRIHFRKESDAVRMEVLRLLAEFDITTTVFTSRRPEAEARRECLHSLVSDAIGTNVQMLIVEADESFRSKDREVIHSLIGADPYLMHWTHVSPSQEPGLWIPDAVGWCTDHPEPRWRKAVATLGIRRIVQDEK